MILTIWTFFSYGSSSTTFRNDKIVREKMAKKMAVIYKDGSTIKMAMADGRWQSFSTTFRFRLQMTNKWQMKIED
jgi:hypothetical protein